MNIIEDIKQLKTGPRDLRKFGLVVGGVFAVLGLFFLWRHKSFYPWFLTPGIVLVVAGAIVPRALKYVYIAWMAMAFVFGFVMAHVILTLFFFLVITPIGLIARISGKDFLQLKLDKSGSSYWSPHERKIKSPSDYERQF
jgi:hypothetical protein